MEGLRDTKGTKAWGTGEWKSEPTSEPETFASHRREFGSHPKGSIKPLKCFKQGNHMTTVMVNFVCPHDRVQVFGLTLFRGMSVGCFQLRGAFESVD